MEFRSDMKVTLVNQTGDDALIAHAARRSTGGKGKSGNVEGLINTLMKDKHGSPFHVGQLTVEVEVPIFVAREWMRHRTQSYSELSARYRKLEPIFWIPSEDRPLVNAGTSMHPRMASGSPTHLGIARSEIKRCCEQAWSSYEYMLAQGIAKEVARSVLPVQIYTNFWATADPRNWLHFLSLRSTKTEGAYPTYPQYEIDQAAQQVEDLFADCWPLTYQAFLANGRVAPI